MEKKLLRLIIIILSFNKPQLSGFDNNYNKNLLLKEEFTPTNQKQAKLSNQGIYCKNRNNVFCEEYLSKKQQFKVESIIINNNPYALDLEPSSAILPPVTSRVIVGVSPKIENVMEIKKGNAQIEQEVTVKAKKNVKLKVRKDRVKFEINY